jgi:hypothetical protein
MNSCNEQEFFFIFLMIILILLNLLINLNNLIFLEVKQFIYDIGLSFLNDSINV